MTPPITDPGCRYLLLHEQNRLDHLRNLACNSVDAIITDGPYGLGEPPNPVSMLRDWLEAGHHDLLGRGFMNQEWDAFIPQPIQWHECLRVLKPGGHLLAFASPRTQDLMGLSIRLGGFEIRDMLAWLYGSGFPKSLNLDEEWEGFGTGLKPALEPITLARKALDGTIAANVLKWHTGALNINACRIDLPEGDALHNGVQHNGHELDTASAEKGWGFKAVDRAPVLGRWPANVMHDGSEEVLSSFPDAPGQQGDVRGTEPTATGFSGHVYGKPTGKRARCRARQESNKSASRFLYCAKASSREREEGLEGLEGLQISDGRTAEADNPRLRAKVIRKNTHPTVKPIALMRWLCRLITPPGGVILDPFLGSGSTGVAALQEGFKFIGIEKSLQYLDIANRRILHTSRKFPA